MAKADIRLMTVDNKRQKRPPDNTGKFLGGPLTGPNIKQGPVIPSHCGEHVLPGKLDNPVSTVKNHTVLDDGLDLENESKIPVGNVKCIFWQISTNDQRPKLRV